jgi:hypothetical protein
MRFARHPQAEYMGGKYAVLRDIQFSTLLLQFDT